MKMALAVITYDRAHYLSLVLPSILSQRINGRLLEEVFDVHVFQDGFCADDQRSDAYGHRRVSEIISGLPPHVHTFLQSENLGVALHFDFIEKLLFREKKYDFVFFCEDDLVLSSQYASVIKKMADMFHADERVGMMSAHPFNPTRTATDQLKGAGAFTEIGHNWAFGLFRAFWEKRQPFVEIYLDMVRANPYRKRNTPRILKWLETCGFNPNGSSQDYVKQCATAALGAVRISTVPNLGLPIGRTGLHCSPELFDRLGFSKTVVCDFQLEELGSLTEKTFREILRSQRAACIQSDGLFPTPAEWPQLVRDGAFDPTKLRPGETTSSMQEAQHSKTWTAADVPYTPHMEPDGLDLLKERLAEANCFLEYGAGGSTMFAANIGIETIYSVESDRGFLDAVKTAVAEAGSGATLIDHYVDIGPTGAWGNPKDSSKATSWPLYASSIWSKILEDGAEMPDLVLIDGRFRVACFLATLMFAKTGTMILFDDYHDRPHYHVVEKYLKPFFRSGRMAEFRTQDSPPPEAMLDLMAHSTTFA